MNKFLNGLGAAVICSIGAAISVMASATFFMGVTGLDTRKIDGNIKNLKSFPWFHRLYEDERHQSSFSINLQVRKYLGSSLRVWRLRSSKKEQQKFVRLLEEVAQARGKNNEEKTVRQYAEKNGPDY